VVDYVEEVGQCGAGIICAGEDCWMGGDEERR